MEHIADRATGFDKVEVMEEHLHSVSWVYPTLAAGEIVTAGAAWTLGVFKEIIPANQIGTDFDIHWLTVEDASADEIFELVLYAVTTEIARKRIAITLTAGLRITVPPVKIQMPIVLKNTQIQAKVATAGGGDTITISLEGHGY